MAEVISDVVYLHSGTINLVTHYEHGIRIGCEHQELRKGDGNYGLFFPIDEDDDELEEPS